MIQPLPHGVTRGAVEDILRGWKWCARPLQPIKGNFQGSAWLIGSEVDPPAPVLSAYDKDVIINPAQQRTTREQGAPMVQASRKTQNHIRLQAKSQNAEKSAQPDPWAGGADPWAAYNSQSGKGSVDKAVSSGQKQIESVKADLQAQMKTALLEELEAREARRPIDVDESATEALVIANQTRNDARFNIMEGSLKELKAQNETMASWMHQTGARLETAEANAHSLQAEMQQVKLEVVQSQNSVHALIQSSFASVRSEMTSEMSNLFSHHFGEFRENMSKKARTD